MRIESVRLRSYNLPMRQPWRAASATLAARIGRLVGVVCDGVVGWGDCAPLPSSGADGHARAFASLEQGASRMRGLPVDDAFALLRDVESAEARWALETALLDLHARKRGLTLRCGLRSDAPATVKVNAALGPLDNQCAIRAAAALAQGIEVAKIKVGIHAPREEAARLAEMSRHVDGRLRLRLDANRAWSDRDAGSFFDMIAVLPIDGVEEPLKEPSLDRLAALQRNVPFALAIDESLFELGPERIFKSGAVRRLVVKPARIGGFRATLRLAEQARAAGLEVVVTSVVDSAVGVAAAAQLAAALGGSIAHGLATSSWLAKDVAKPLAVSGGNILLPDGPGLGIAPEGEFAQAETVDLAVGKAR